MKFLHRPAHTIDSTLHREAYSRGSRLKLVVLGAMIGGLLTGAGTFAVARVNTRVARIHAQHRRAEWREHRMEMAALHTIAAHHGCTRP